MFSGGDTKRTCQSFCVPSPVTDLPPDTLLIDDNTISGPGSESSSPDPLPHTELPDHLNQITEELGDNTAVRRAVQDNTEELVEIDQENADNEVVQQQLARTNSGKPVNFVAEQLGEERKKKMNELNGRLPRNRNYGEGEKLKLDTILSLDINEENEIIEENGDDSKNDTSSDSLEVEESRSSHGKKSSKLIGTPNEVRQSFKQKNIQDSTNLIVDSVKPQGRRVGTDVSLRRKKRNVSDNEDLSSANRASQPVTATCLEPGSEVRVRTQAGTVTLSEAYCDNCLTITNNCSYHIPLSPLMPDTQIAILFSGPVEQCRPSPSSVTAESVEGLMGDTFPVLVSVPAGDLVSEFSFRMSPGGQSGGACQSSSPATFLDINIRLYRVC